MNSKTKRRGVVAGILLTLALATGAYAYWTNSGSGTGAATTANPSGSLVITQLGSISNLAPGSGAQTVQANIQNNTGAAVRVSQLSVSLAGTTWNDDGVNPPCSAADYTISGSPLVFGPPIDLAAGDDVDISSGISIAFNNTGANQDNCKGQALNLTFSAN